VVLSRTGVDVMSEQYFTRPNVQPVITNIGTTPEQRQMSTSEFKAKFDEMPEAIQQYIKETLLTELDAFKQDFMTHQAESASKHITESGSNPNGSYIKFDDGTMICYMKKILTRGFGSNPKGGQLGLWIGGNGAPFPADFALPPIINATLAGSPLNLSIPYYTTFLRIFDIDETSYDIRCYSDESIGGFTGSDDSITVNVIAIGRWK
jgi:hypothetical protein